MSAELFSSLRNFKIRKFRFVFELKRSRIKETLKSHLEIAYFRGIVRERIKKRNTKWVNAILRRQAVTFVIVEAPSKIALTCFSV